MNMNDLKSGEPFFGRWYIKDYIGLTGSGSLYLIYCVENGVYEYNKMKVIGVPKDKQELKQIQYQVLDYDSTVQYYKELVTDMYREICLVEELYDKSHLLSYKDHMIFQRGNGVGYDVFLRMEYLPNITEGTQMLNLSIQDVLYLGKDICDALRICEINHIVHGDLRPESIFVSENGSYKLGDFSFQRISKQNDVITGLKDMADYIAPEIYHGAGYDNRADIYSLGLVLYQLLNDNKLPYMSVALGEASLTERQLAMKQRFENPILPRPVHATDELAKVIIKACDLNPKQRYQSAEEFKDALTAIAIFLDSDIILGDKNHIVSEDIYINNEVVVTSKVSEPVSRLQIPVDFESDKREKRKREEVRAENKKNKKSLLFSFLVVVFAASLIVVLTKLDINKQLPSSVMITTQPSIKPSTMELTPQPTIAVPEEVSLITINKSGKKLTSLETITDLDKAIAIDLSNNELTKLDGIKDAVNIETLILSHNNIVNVDTLHTLTNLKALDISNNQVSSFIKLRNLEQLEILAASNNRITSLDGLEKMTALKVLYLDGNSIQDISILKDLTRLEILDLSNNEIKDKDIEALKKALPECVITY